MILFWDTALWKWQRGAVDLIHCGMYSLILRLGWVHPTYITLPCLRYFCIFLDSLSLSHCTKHLALFHFLAQEGLFSGAAPLCAVLRWSWCGEGGSGAGRRRIEHSVKTAQNIPK